MQITRIAPSHTFIKAWRKEVVCRCDVVHRLHKGGFLFSENRIFLMVLT